jgi:chromosome segregation ATPase
VRATLEERVENLEQTVAPLNARVKDLEDWAGPGQNEVFSANLVALRKQLEQFGKVQARHEAKLDGLTTVQALHTKMLQDHATKLDGLTTDVTGLKKDVATLKTDVTGLKKDVATLKTDVTGLKKDVATLKTDVATLKTGVAELKTGVAELKADMREVKGTLSEILLRLPPRPAETTM